MSKQFVELLDTAANATDCLEYGAGGGGAVDRRKPVQTLGGRKRQKLKGLAVTVRVDEAAKLTAAGTVRFGKRRLKLRKATRSAKAVRR